MSQREIIARYNLIIKKLRRGPCTFNELSSYLEIESEIQSYDFQIAKRTFKRDRDDICSLYGIDIKFDFSKKVYYIDCDEDSEASVRILEAFDTLNALNISDRFSSHIHFEKRKPAGTENLYGLLHAIKNRVQIKFQYQKFWENENSVREVEPYLLKESKNRWYVLAKDMKDGKIKSFGLDRLSELEITSKKFKFPVDENLDSCFKYCFGIISPTEELPEDIILSFEPIQGKYIKSLPLHESQQILVDNETELRIGLKLFITHDFVMEILSYGHFVKVIQPFSLVDEIKKAHNRAYKQYAK
jgi:predicted DNA-binding transcriptional regulator YafY